MSKKLKFDELEASTPVNNPLEAAANQEVQIGRTTKVRGCKLDKKISCYFTADEMELIDQARGGTAKATFVRDLVLKEIEANY